MAKDSPNINELPDINEDNPNIRKSFVVPLNVGGYGECYKPKKTKAREIKQETVEVHTEEIMTNTERKNEVLDKVKIVAGGGFLASVIYQVVLMTGLKPPSFLEYAVVGVVMLITAFKVKN